MKSVSVAHLFVRPQSPNAFENTILTSKRQLLWVEVEFKISWPKLFFFLPAWVTNSSTIICFYWSFSALDDLLWWSLDDRHYEQHCLEGCGSVKSCTSILQRNMAFRGVSLVSFICAEWLFHTGVVEILDFFLEHEIQNSSTTHTHSRVNTVYTCNLVVFF